MANLIRQQLLKDYVDFKTGKLDSNAAVENGMYPFFTCSRETFKTNTFAFDQKAVLLAGNNAAGIFPIKYFEGKFDAYQRTYVITSKDPDETNIRYVFYALIPLLGSFKTMSTGTTTKFLTKTILDRVEIPLPAKSEQDQIADILSAYDDLIENNSKRIEKLEAMARLLYKNFLISRDDKKAYKINDLVDIQNGFAFKSNTFSADGRFGVVTIKNVQDGIFNTQSLSRIDFVPERMPMHCKLNKGDILMSLTGNVGRVCMVTADSMLLNQRVAKLVSNYSALTYCMFRSREMLIRLENLSNGTAQQNLSPVMTRDLIVDLPQEQYIEEFENLCKPLLSQIVKLNEKNSVLIEARDLLLPRLMSGEIEL